MNSTRTFTYETMIAEIKSGYMPAGNYAIVVETATGELLHYGFTSGYYKFPGYGEMLAAKRRQGWHNPKISRSQRATVDAQYTRERVFELFREKSQNNRRVALIYCANWFTKFVAAQSGIDAGEYEYPALLPADDAGMFPAAHPRPSVPAALADCYDDFAEFQAEVERLWSLDECLEYPCQTTLARALELMGQLARTGGYDALRPAYEKFTAVCRDNVLTMDADRLLQDYQPGRDRDSRWYGMVKK